MNREILFRGKRLDNGEWAYGYLEKRPSAIQGPDYGGPWYIWTPPVDPDDSGGYYNVDPATVGQYTGLMDKIGKKIFEGDIVKMDSFTPPVKQISFIEGAFCLANKNGEYCADIHYIHHSMKNQATVIGNRWDNPELLEVKR